MTWRTFWRFTLAVGLGGTVAVIVGGLITRALWFAVVLDRLP